MSCKLALLISPFILQAICMFFDELYYHRKRGLPKWEKIGHPIDTISVAACYAFVLFNIQSSSNLSIYIALAIFSCLLITKDELIHKEEACGKEQWLHSLLFILHPITLMTLLGYWYFNKTISFLDNQEFVNFQKFINYQFILTITFGFYQTLYWNIPWQKLKK